ncbi:MAG: ABC transporter ATP-binding protein [Bacteroidaceae bacterium]|jgi:iron complex transport system ATP-binding protein|nr:ABC transporter ATP-binding protein [Bacteroidaceae bacterium]
MQLQLNHLTTGYGNRIVTPDINATLVPGELTSLLGPNGVGKSTLLRTLSTFLPPLQGEIVLQGKSLNSLSASQLSRLVGVVLTERPDVQNMTVRDMVGMGRSPYTGFWGRLTMEDEQYVTEAMKLAGITVLEKRMFSTLSDGERQKVMIAKVLAQQTPVILLDEPTAFLDFPSKVETLRLLRRLAHEMQKIIFLSTHDVELALQLSDRLWIMHAGEVVIGKPVELSENGELSRFIQTDGIRFDPSLMSYRITEK